MIRLSPPSGGGWKDADAATAGIRLKAPPDARVDASPDGSRVLLVTLADSPSRPRPALRVDRFAPRDGDPVDIDAEYAAAYAEQYSQAAFQGKLDVSESGQLVLRKKTNMAMVGGIYPYGAARAFRLQCVYLAADRQFFVTFDCAEQDWPLYEDRVGQMLLSLEIRQPRER